MENGGAAFPPDAVASAASLSPMRVEAAAGAETTAGGAEAAARNIAAVRVDGIDDGEKNRDAKKSTTAPAPPASPVPLVSPRSELRLRQQQHLSSTSEEEEAGVGVGAAAQTTTTAAAAAAAARNLTPQKRSPSRRTAAATASKRIAALSTEGKTMASPAWFSPSLIGGETGKKGGEEEEDDDDVDDDVLAALAALSCAPLEAPQGASDVCEPSVKGARAGARAVRSRRG